MRDSAAALARSPLFSQLGRLDLARLAGELEDVVVPAGTFLMREGEPASELYVIRSGTARVFTGAFSADRTPTLLGPGEIIGEMAVLGAARRTASVVAETDMLLWRLSAERFLTLLDQDRNIAAAIERALVGRLAAATREAAEHELQGQALARVALRVLSADARRLLPLLALLPRWSATVVETACAATRTTAALSSLQEHGTFLWQEGTELGVAPAVAAVLDHSITDEDRTWLRKAASLTAAAGRYADAVTLWLEAGDTAPALRIVQAHTGLLSTAAPPEQRKHWVLRAAEHDAAAAERMAALLNAAARPDEAAADEPHMYVVQRGVAEARAHRESAWLLRYLPAPMLLAGAAAAVLYALGWIAPLPAGLARAGMVTLGALAATTPLLMLDALPEYGVAALLVLALAATGAFGPDQILAGFSTPSWMLLVTLFALSAAVTRSGLFYRAALLAIERLPVSFPLQSAVLAAIGIFLSAAVPSSRARMALIAPMARGLADAFRYGNQTGGSAAFGLVTLFTAGQATFFATSSSMSIVLFEMVAGAVQGQFSWWHWVIAAGPPNLVLALLSYLAILVLLRPPLRTVVDKAKVRTQRDLLGPITQQEVAGTVILTLLVLGLATQSLHGLSAVWLAVAAFVALLASRTLDRETFQNGISWGQVMFVGVFLGIEGIFAAAGLDQWLLALFASRIRDFTIDAYALTLLLFVCTSLLVFIIPYYTLCIVLSIVMMPVAQALGYHPFIPVVTILIATDHSLVPRINATYMTLYYATDGELFTHQQARPVLLLEGALRLAALLISIPVWDRMGLLTRPIF